jgi:hypothetical protein
MPIPRCKVGAFLAGVIHPSAVRATPPPVRREPLLYWRPVAAAGGASLFLIAALAVWLAVASPPRSLADAPEPVALASPQTTPEASKPEELPQPPTRDLPPEQPAPVREKPKAETPAAPAAPAPAEVKAPAAARPAPPEPGKSPTALLGTTVEFVDNPAAAARAAAREDKLLYVLHVSGNFEDPQFT